MGLKGVLEEIEILRSIFCQDGEITLHSDIDSIKDDSKFSISYSIGIEMDLLSTLPEHLTTEYAGKSDDVLRDPVVITLTATVNEKYPIELEGLSLKSTKLIKRSINEMKNKLDNYIKENLLNQDEEPFMINVVKWIQDSAKDYYFASVPCTQQGEERDEAKKRCVVLTLDHMRSKDKYIKLITGWMNELNLIGRIVFYKKMIWVVLHGTHNNVKDYLKRHKICNVDVDSNGRPCKERMMTIIIDMESAIDSNV